MSKKKLSKGAEFIKSCRDPFYFIEMMWGITRQKPYPQHEQAVKNTEPEDWKAEWFGEEVESEHFDFKIWKWFDFQKGKNLTWQQTAIIEGVRRAVEKGNNKITVKTGNGIGKTTTASFLILWFLFVFKESVVPCTAPTSTQIKDVLWGEVALWLNRMPKIYNEIYEHTSEYIRIKTNPQFWFARARTARDEKPEAFSGVHADSVLAIADESSGVSDIIYEYGDGIKTSPFWIFLMFSNPTRTTGYFRKSFSETSTWRQYSFDSRESPVVDHQFVQEKINNSGFDSDDFRVFVEGKFPKDDSIDKFGYVPLLTESQLENAMIDDGDLRFSMLGIDPAGEGNDKTAFVGRSVSVAKILGEEAKSTPISVASMGTTLASQNNTKQEQIAIDAFGEGGKVGTEMAKMGYFANAINVGDKPDDKRFLNKRAELFWKIREWITNGGQLVRDKRWFELLNIRYQYNQAGKLQILSKDKMSKMGIKSPNFADAFSLTFAVSPTGSQPVADETVGGDIY